MKDQMIDRDQYCMQHYNWLHSRDIENGCLVTGSEENGIAGE